MAQSERRLTVIMDDRDARILDGVAAQHHRDFEEEFVESLRIGVGLLQEIVKGKTLIVEDKDGRLSKAELILESTPQPVTTRRIQR